MSLDFREGIASVRIDIAIVALNTDACTTYTLGILRHID
jgi:hypothetical protein